MIRVGAWQSTGPGSWEVYDEHGVCAGWVQQTPGSTCKLYRGGARRPFLPPADVGAQSDPAAVRAEVTAILATWADVSMAVTEAGATLSVPVSPCGEGG